MGEGSGMRVFNILITFFCHQTPSPLPLSQNKKHFGRGDPMGTPYPILKLKNILRKGTTANLISTQN
jgi:hypothetical protein